MSRNLRRINNFFQRREAWRDWEYVAARARAAGHCELAKRHAPPAGSGVARIDKAIGKLRAELNWPPVYELRKQDGQP